MKSESIGKLAEALAKAQHMMENAKKDTANPFFKSKYADLAGVIEAVREPLAKNNLSYVQFGEEENGVQFLTTMLMHSSGEWIQGRVKLLLSKQDMQGFGSANTYARRYGLSAMVGITQEDDDGNLASGKGSSDEGKEKTGPKVVISQKPASGQISDDPDRGFKFRCQTYFGNGLEVKQAMDFVKKEFGVESLLALTPDEREMFLSWADSVVKDPGRVK